MRFSKTAASIMAAAMAVSALSAGAFAEENKIRLMTAEIPAELATSMVFFDGVGVVDITGEKFDSSENGNADKDAKLDVDFDGLGYVSEKNLEAWRDTGVLTFSKLKADFDTKGLQWGMFSSKNNYVQFVKRNGDEITERAVYKITDGDVKKVYDLDTFWTVTREDGVSVGVEAVNDTFHMKMGDYGYDSEKTVELKLVVTQPDGTRSVRSIAKADTTGITDNNITINYNDEAAMAALREKYSIGNYDFTSAWTGDVLLGAGVFYCSLLSEMDGSNEVKVLYADDTEKVIYTGDKYAEFSAIYPLSNGNVLWKTGTPGGTDIYFYDVAAGKTESYSFTFSESNVPYGFKIKSFGDKIVGECKIPPDMQDIGYAIFDDLEDLKNYNESKTYYKKITDCGDNVYLYETLDGKKGYMDGDEKVLGEFDDAEEFSAKYAPVVKGGKAYLVDKKMNVVSEQIDADSVSAVSDNIFIVNKGDKKYFATFEGGKADDTPSTPSKPSTPAVLVDYSDDSTGIKASANEGVVADGAKLSVAAVADKTNDKNFTYEISFKKDGKAVQPNGKVTVKIPVPEAIKDKTIYVYRVEEGKYTDMKAKLENGFVVFETDHFSEYLVTTEKKNADKPSNPATGVAGGVFGVMAIAGAFVIVSKKRS